MTRVPPTTLRWPWQRRLDARRKREADSADRLARRRERAERLTRLDPETICAECGHPLNAHPKEVASAFLLYPSQPCRATVTRRYEHGDDVWPCGCRDFKEPAE